MSGIAELPTQATKTRDSTIHLLTETLAKAVAGEVREIVMVMFEYDGTHTVLASPSMDVVHKVGALEIAKIAIIEEYRI